MKRILEMCCYIAFCFFAQIVSANTYDEPTDSISGKLDFINSDYYDAINIENADFLEITVNLDVQQWVSGVDMTGSIVCILVDYTGHFFESYNIDLVCDGSDNNPSLEQTFVLNAPNDILVELHYYSSGAESSKAFEASFSVNFEVVNSANLISASSWVYSEKNHEFFFSKNVGDSLTPFLKEDKSFVFYDDSYMRSLGFGPDSKLKFDYTGLTVESDRSVEVILDSNGDDDYKVFDVKPESTDNDPVFRVFEDGRVGVNVNTPLQKLHVGGSVIFDDLSSSFSNLRIGHDKHDLIMADNHGYNGGGLVFRVSEDNSDDSFIDVMKLTNQGNVGIGRGRPACKLDVSGDGKFDGDLYVTGTIKATEVIIEMRNDTWPDFVFSDDYNLLDLSEVEAHIIKNGHLPAVPSASQVAEDGISVGEMNRVLLQKVEELTLYMIEQQKEIDQLKENMK